jgi:hypothetical protein
LNKEQRLTIELNTLTFDPEARKIKERVCVTAEKV